jgi:spermidine/putrescine-binding protein
MASGEVWAMYGWIAMRVALQKQGHNVTNNWPKEGLVVWNQSAFIPKDSKKADASHRVINAFLSKEYGVKLTELTNYPSTSEEVAASFSKEEQHKFGFDVEKRDCRIYPLDLPKRLDLWVEAWSKFKAA